MSSRTQAFETDTDIDLLGYMAMVEADRGGAQAAFQVFYSRHGGWLYRTVQINLPTRRLLGGEDGVADVVQETFQRVFERAATFQDEGTTDPIRARRRVRAWLGTIAKNVVVDTIRRFCSPRPEDCVPWEGSDTAELLAAPSECESVDEARLRAIIDELSPRDQEILWASAQHYQPGRPAQRLPSGVCQALADKWDTTPENIRQRRHRLYRQIREQLDLQESTAEEQGA